MELKHLLMCLVLLSILDSFAKAIAPVLSQKIFIGPDALGITPRSDMNSFICCFRSSNVLCFTRRSRHDALLGTAPTDSSTIQYKYVSGLRLRVIRISVKACIDITIYDELFVTSINEKHILSPFQVFQDVLDRCPVLHSGITLVPPCYTYIKAHIRSGTQHCIHDRTYG